MRRYSLAGMLGVVCLLLNSSHLAAEDRLQAAMQWADANTVALAQIAGSQLKPENPLLGIYPALSAIGLGPNAEPDGTAKVQGVLVGLSTNLLFPFRFIAVELDADVDQSEAERLFADVHTTKETASLEWTFSPGLYLGRSANLGAIPAEDDQRAWLTDAVEQSRAFPVWLAFAPSQDQRRVVVETLPAEEAIAGAAFRSVAESARWASWGMDVNTPQNWQLIVQCSNADTASQVAQALGDIMANQRLLELLRFPPLPAEKLQFDVRGDQLVLTHEQGAKALLAAMDSAMEATRQASDRMEAMSSMRHLMLAIHHYQMTNKGRMPLAIQDKQGQPLLSWRVMLLPHLGLDELYQRFRLDEPWDSEHNRALLAEMPEVYAFARSAAAAEGKTVLQIVTGPKTVAPEDEMLTHAEVTDGAAHTIAIIEASEPRAIEWTRPGDWSIESDPQTDAGGHLTDVILTAFMDGSTRALPTGIKPWIIERLLTATGGEAIPKE